MSNMYEDGGAIPEDDYSKFSYQGQSQDLPTGNPGGPEDQVMGGNTGSWDALRNTQQSLPTGNPDMNEGQLPVANRGSVPTQPGGGSGNLPVPEQQHSGPIAAIIAYLHGTGAAPAQQVKQVEAGVDPQGAMDPNQRTVAGIQAAADQGGPDVGAAFIQTHRQMYNAKQGFARAALNGSQGKPADLNAAVNAANQAYYHVPDGKSVQFATDGQGVTATVNGKHFQLTPQQFDQWLDVGGKGQFDNVYENGVDKVLAGLAQPQAQGAQGAIPEQGGAASHDPSRPFAAPDVVAQHPGKYQAMPAGYKSPDVPDAGFDATTAERARRIAPGDMGRQTQIGMAEEARQEGNQNKIDVEKEKGNTQRDIWGTRTQSNEKVAETRAGAYVTSAQLKADAAKGGFMQKAQAAAQASHDRNLATAARVINAKVMSGQALTPEDQKIVDGIYKTSAGGPAQPANQPANQGAAQTRVVGNVTYTKHPDGKWYPAGQ